MKTMDLMATVMGASALSIGIVAAILILVGWDKLNLNLSQQTESFAKVGAVVAVVALLFNMGFLAIDSGADDDGLDIVGDVATWDAVATSSTANTTVSGNTILTTYTLAETGAFAFASSGSVTISFACKRTDTNIADGITSAYVVSVPTTTNVTSGVTHDVLTKDALGVFSGDFTVDGVVSEMSATYPGEADDRTETVSLTIVFTAAAVEALAQYATFSIQYSVGGEVFTHSVMHMDATA
jgi:hypothetical protein